MSRLQHAEPVLKAARQWRDACLLNRGSALSDEQLWTKDNFAALRRHFVENPDEGKRGFFEKLEDQLAPAPPSARQLAAELLWVMYLVVRKSSMSGETKRFQIRKVWEWSGDALDMEQWALQEPLQEGVAHPGTAYHTHRPLEFAFFVTTMIDWLDLPTDERNKLLHEPWAFGRWLGDRANVKGRQLRHALLFLLFPDDYECILSSAHKKNIAKRFNAHWEQSTNIDYGDQLSVDQAVLAVRERLEREYGDEEVHFYREPHQSVWTDDAQSVPDPSPPQVSLGESQEWFRQRFGHVGVWAMAAGQGARMWPTFQRDGIAAIGWDEIGDLTQYESKEEVRDALVSQGQSNPVMDTLALWQFAQDIKPGDVIVAKKGRSKLLGWGVVQDEYEYDSDRQEYQHTREVDWKSTNSADIPRDQWITNKTLTDFSPHKDFVRLAFDLMESHEAPADSDATDPQEAPEERGPSYSVDDALADLFVPPADFTRILDAMALRKNVILQGPPGVGKTYIAKRIAWTLIGRKIPDCVEMVQFHQSYSYEDFVQGWRPTESGGFSLRNGVFHNFCTRAAAKPGTPHVFIIDEINRGNLSRIFGELLMLIEADKRGSAYSIPLTYSQSGERFSVPENLHILGLMNTADRSLAMVDYALRRRFAFVSLRPAFGSEQLQQYLLDAGAEESVVKIIDERMCALNEKIRKDTKNLGPGFEIGHSYFVPSESDESLDEPWFQNIVHTQIEPLLREYWFDQPEEVKKLLSDLLP